MTCADEISDKGRAELRITAAPPPSNRHRGQVVRLQDLHDLPVRLGHDLPGPVGGKASNRQPTNRGDPLPEDTMEIT
jgi:hypothetical protein